ncbi:acetylornithine deacetylase [Roseovarius aquimarinus]|uniref:Acetylornithine deacetylase n=1 Tax=Roseovarius aquimarinus TaxID=1229156 RepID=A0ABW7I5J5_9RHOB
MPHPATLDILDSLIGFPTVSADSNLALIDHAEGLLKAAGFATRRLPAPGGAKCGLLARIGPEGPGGLLLSAHSDVVPVEGQEWSRPAFRLTREADRLYGRGTTDMKGFLASMLSLATRAKGAPLARPLMLCISYDEEIGCLGLGEMMPGIRAMGWMPDLCIVGEPTRMRPAIGHKGKLSLRATCHGTAGHSSLAPRHVNALYLATELVTALRAMQADYAGGAVQDAAYDVPYSSVHAGVLRGGHALNIVPDRATLDFELRYLPGDDPADFRARLDAEIARILAPHRRVSGRAAIEIAVTAEYPGLAIPADAPAIARIAALGCDAAPIKVAFGTEAGFFAAEGMPTLVCGPGDMEGQGHKADEYITLAEMAACDAMMDRLLDTLG